MIPPGGKRVRTRLALLEAARQGQEALWLIEACLVDEHPEVRARAIELAAELLAPERLVDLLDRDDLVLRAAACEALVRCGARALPALRAALASGERREVSLACVQVLGLLEEPEGLALLRSLAAQGDELLRAAAIQALGQRKDRASVPVLIGALQADPWVAISAFEALAQIGDPSALTPLQRLASSAPLAEFACAAIARIQEGASRA